MRRAISVLVVVGLALAVVLLWVNRGGDSPPGTQAQASTTALPPATTSLPPDTTTLATTTTTSPTEIEIVETVEQAEAILRELWFGWFEGIYNEDEDRIREVVVLEETVEQATQSFGVLEFSMEPAVEDIALEETELLSSDSECLAVWVLLDVSSFRPGASGAPGVNVLRHINGAWRILSVWPNRGDLWQEDCDSEL
jgi:hypothetical protein